MTPGDLATKVGRSAMAPAEAESPLEVGLIAGRAWHWLLALALPLSAAALAFADQAVFLLFGPDFDDAVGPLRILTVASIVAIPAALLGMCSYLGNSPGRRSSSRSRHSR